MKRVLSLLLVLLFLSGCSSQGPAAESKDTPNVVLTYYTIGNEDPDLKMVNEALNALMVERYGFGVDYRKIDFNTYEDTINGIINTDQKFDILFTWDTHYLNNAQKGIFMDLTPYLESEGFSLQNTVDYRFWKGVQVNGKIYGVPTNKELAPVVQFLFSQSLTQKYHIHPENYGSIQSLEPLLSMIKDSEPEVLPLLFTSDRINLADLAGYEYVAGRNLPFVVKKGDHEAQVVNLYEVEEMQDLLLTLRRYYEMGYINADASIRSADRNFRGENIFCRISTGGPDSGESFSVDYGYPIVTSSISKPWVTNATARGGIMAVNAKTDHPKEALTFLTAVNLDPEVRNLLNYGIEGEHYKLTDQDQVSMISEGYRGVPYTQGNWFILKTMEGENPRKWENYKLYNEQAESSCLLGFEPDLKGYTQEKNQISQIYLRYDTALLTGSVDPEIHVPRALRQMHLAGEETLLRELQRQVDSWISRHPCTH